MSSFVAASLLLAMPILAVPNVNKIGAMEISPRANYLGGWSQGRDGTGGGCPSSATACDEGDYSLLNTQCCPNGQTCFASSIIVYCCPTATDCSISVQNFPVCAGAGLTMYESPGGYFCCEANEKGVTPSGSSSSFDGLCVPADQPVASSQLAKTQTQLGTLATSTGAPGSVVSSASSAVASAVSSAGAPASSRTNPAISASLTPLSSGSSGNSGSSITTGVNGSPTSSPNSGDPPETTDKPSSGSSKLGVGPIVGIAIGGVAILLLAGILFFLIKRSREKKTQQTAYNSSQQYGQVPQGPGIPEVSGVGVAPGMGRKPVAATTTNPAYNTSPSAGYVSPISTSPSPGPPGYANLAQHPQGPYGAPPPPPAQYNPHANYSEMDSNGYPVNRVELRGSQ